MRLSCALILGFVAGAAQAFAQPVPPREDAAVAARVDAIFKDFAKPTSPGCAVAAYQDDRILYRAAYGMANLDHDVPLTSSSIFHVASVSKQFTATAILLLAQDGKLSIDDDVRKHIPELPDFGHKITIRHLANHTSGIRDQWTMLGLAGWRYSRDLITDDDVLEVLARQKELNFKPGERHLYSNSGYTLMALIVSRVSGRSFREFTTERVFRPLGMLNTHFRDRFTEIVKNQAYGYSPDRDTFRLSVTNFDTAGATSLLTTVEDMARWHANFDTPSVGGDRLIAGLLERGVLNDGRNIDYAFGITHGLYRGLRTVGHGGSDAGYRSAFLRFPEQRFGVATLCNVSTANPTALSQRVADVYLADKLQPQTSEAADSGPEVPWPADQLKSYAGLYWNEDQAAARKIVFDNGKLHAVVGRERVLLKSLGESRFVLTAGQPLRVQFEAGSASGAPRLRLGPEASDIFDRAEPFTPTAAQLEEFAGVYRSDEIDAVFRLVLKDRDLRLERSKSAPTVLEPLVSDTFGGQPGTIRFVRNAEGRVTGFVLDAGRVRHMKFWKESAPARPRP